MASFYYFGFKSVNKFCHSVLSFSNWMTSTNHFVIKCFMNNVAFVQLIGKNAVITVLFEQAATHNGTYASGTFRWPNWISATQRREKNNRNWHTFADLIQINCDQPVATKLNALTPWDTRCKNLYKRFQGCCLTASLTELCALTVWCWFVRSCSE